MSGHVFHPGHEELHGVTVVVEGASGRVYLGRYHERTERGLVLHDVAVHDPAAATLARADWIAGVRKFGVPVEQRSAVVAATEVAAVIKLVDYQK